MRFRTPLTLLIFLLLVVGCQSPRVGRPLPPALAANDPDAQINFWRVLTDQPVTSNDEAFHGLLLFVDGKDNSADYAARVATLKERKMLPAKFDQPAEAGVRRGVLAVAIMRILNQRGGLTTSLFGPTPRYATRELMFLNVYPPSTPNQVFSGTEFVGIIGRVEDYQRGNPEQVVAGGK